MKNVFAVKISINWADYENAFLAFYAEAIYRLIAGQVFMVRKLIDTEK